MKFIVSIRFYNMNHKSTVQTIFRRSVNVLRMFNHQIRGFINNLQKYSTYKMFPFE